MSVYFTDVITHIPITAIDKVYAKETLGVPVDYDAQVEDVSQLVNMSLGLDIEIKMLIYLDYNVPLKAGEYVIIKKRWNELTNDTTRYKVVIPEKPIGFSPSHLEVWLGRSRN